MTITDLREEFSRLMKEPSTPERWKEEGELRNQAASLPEYSQYHVQCVNACAALMGEEHRQFFDGCSYEEPFLEGVGPEEVAFNERDALCS